MSVVVRDATLADVPAWARMRGVLWPEADAAEHAAEIERTLARDDAATFIATDDDEPIGMVEVSIRRDPLNGCETSPVAFMEGLYVGEGHRRHGVARDLLAAVEGWAASRGCVELGSDADAANRDGQAFHLAAGFEESERVIFYRKTLSL